MKNEPVNESTKEIFIENISTQKMSDIHDKLSEMKFNVEECTCEPFKEVKLKYAISSSALFKFLADK